MDDAVPTLMITVLDCPDPVALSGFYSDLTGFDRAVAEEDWCQLDSNGIPRLAFQRVDGYQPPDWPGQEHPQQAHLDFLVVDPDAAEARALSIGARTHPHQPGGDFRVYLDPAGHPFCLVQAPPRLIDVDGGE